jgi:hypothetical protein
MRQIVFFLTHNFKPLFRRTLSLVDSNMPPEYDAMVLLDDRHEAPQDLGLNRIPIAKCRRHPSPFDPLGQAHNFYVDMISRNPSILESYDHFWVVENDVYFHGSMVDFFRAHDPFDTDLLVPEYGQRDPRWCWLNSAKGIAVTPCGVTAVIYRASRRLMEALIGSISEGVSAHMEVILPHICMRDGMSVRQFVPDLVSVCNTYRSPLLDLIEKDLSEGTSRHIQRKLYHPVKS